MAVAPDGTLYAGGSFTTAGGVPVNHIARWDGASWSALGSGVSGTDHTYVSALAVAADGTLYAGGRFTHAGATMVNYIARWDGTSWSKVGGGVSGGNDYWRGVSALAIAPDGILYVGGHFTSAGPILANNIAQWDGASWNALGGGTDASVYSLAVAPDGTLYTGGLFTIAGGMPASYLAQWDGNEWGAIGSGANDSVRALAVAPDDALYAGGSFSTAGGVPARHIARWDGSAWSVLGSGSGIPGSRFESGYIQALAASLDGTLYAGGDFTRVDGIAANHIARWDGTAWNALSSGLSCSCFEGTHVFALEVAPDALYVGGSFSHAGGSEASHIAQWDGASWSALGGGINGTGLFTRVDALVVAPDGTLYAGGNFTTAGGVPVNHIARWDGTSWSALGGGISGDAHPGVYD
ncbi:MAG: hypothetical protein ACRDIB_15935, partial [Ardenticatenaceae bacterium]